MSDFSLGARRCSRFTERVRHRLEAGNTLAEAEELSRVSRQGEHLTVQLDLKDKELNEDKRAARKRYVVTLDTSAANAAVGIWIWIGLHVAKPLQRSNLSSIAKRVKSCPVQTPSAEASGITQIRPCRVS
jgi:hypothetical protein